MDAIYVVTAAVVCQVMWQTRAINKNKQMLFHSMLPLQGLLFKFLGMELLPFFKSESFLDMSFAFKITITLYLIYVKFTIYFTKTL